MGQQLRHEMRAIDRQITRIEREEFKIKMTIKEHAKKGQADAARMLAKSLVQSRKAKNRMHMTKTQINSVSMQIQQQMSMARVAGALQKSSAVMAAMSQLVRMTEICATMQALSKEMMKAGLIEEMMDDAFEAVEDDDLDEAADEEVDKVMMELTSGLLQANVGATTPAAAEHVDEDTVESDALSARLAAL